MEQQHILAVIQGNAHHPIYEHGDF
jgi:hypothetical protein